LEILNKIFFIKEVKTSTSPGSRDILKLSTPFLVIEIPKAGTFCFFSSIFFVEGFKLDILISLS